MSTIKLNYLVMMSFAVCGVRERYKEFKKELKYLLGITHRPVEIPFLNGTLTMTPSTYHCPTGSLLKRIFRALHFEPSCILISVKFPTTRILTHGDCVVLKRKGSFFNVYTYNIDIDLDGDIYRHGNYQDGLSAGVLLLYYPPEEINILYVPYRSENHQVKYLGKFSKRRNDQIYIGPNLVPTIFRFCDYVNRNNFDLSKSIEVHYAFMMDAEGRVENVLFFLIAGGKLSLILINETELNRKFGWLQPRFISGEFRFSLLNEDGFAERKKYVNNKKAPFCRDFKDVKKALYAISIGIAIASGVHGAKIMFYEDWKAFMKPKLTPIQQNIFKMGVIFSILLIMSRALFFIKNDIAFVLSTSVISLFFKIMYKYL